MFDDLDDEEELDFLEGKSSDLDPDLDKGQTVGDVCKFILLYSNNICYVTNKLQTFL